MRRLTFILTGFFTLFSFSLFSFSQNVSSYQFRLKNNIGIDRVEELVEVQTPLGLDLGNCSLMDENDNVIPFEITFDGKARFQASISAVSTKGYVFTTGNRLKPNVKTYAAVKMPESRADIAWENDLCAYRMYSTVLLNNEPNTAQGVDVWQKKMSVPVIDNMYSLSNYHAESQYGMDVYSVNGKRLGCGGTAAIVNGKLVMHNPYNSCEFIEQTNLKQVFKLTYDNVIIDGDVYKKTIIIECSANGMMNKATLKLEGKIKPVKIAVGIYDHNDMGLALEAKNFMTVPGLIGRAEMKSEGSVSTENARFYQGVYMPGDNVANIEIDNHLCLVTDYTPGNELTYYFGAGWNHFPVDFCPNDEDWFVQLELFKIRTENPIVSTGFNILPKKDDVLSILNSVNQTWQEKHPSHGDFFWNRAVYYIGNMHAFDVTGNMDYLNYAMAWAEKNNWRGRDGSSDPTQWKWTYGESYNYVLFGDNQVCFQVYADLYNLDPNKDQKKIERALEVMGYEISTDEEGYIWWVDGLFMVMPVLSKLYKITGNQLYLDKMYTYWKWYTDRMYDYDENLYYRDANYVYPEHKTLKGKKDFWARGDGWIFAAFAKILQDVPENDMHREEYVTYYKSMAKALKECQQDEGYWERSLIDPEQAPGYETSGTAFFAYGYAWGINNGILSEDEYGATLEKAWNYLSNVAYQQDGTVGYIQPIGAQAIPGQILYPNSYYDFGVGAFLMAASEIYKFAADDMQKTKLRLYKAVLAEADEILLTFNTAPDPVQAAVVDNYLINGVSANIKDIIVNNQYVTICLNEPLDYGCYNVEVRNIQTVEGGTIAENQIKTILLTVPLTPVQDGVSVTANGEQSGNPVINAIDNNLNTRWSMEGKGSWIVVDLGDEFVVEAVDIAFYNGNQRKAFFNVLTSLDAKTYKTVLSNMESSGLTTQLERYKFTPVNARYVRVFCNGTTESLWNSITEIRVRVRDNSIDNIMVPEEIYSDILLPQQTDEGNAIVWTSSDKGVVSGNGLTELGDEDKPVTLTATVGTTKKSFNVLLKARNPWKNLQLLYKFNDEDVYKDNGITLIKDYSEYQRNAVLMGEYGKVKDNVLDLTGNKPYDFNNNSYLVVPDHLLDSLRSYTVAFMAKPISLDRQPRFYDFGAQTGNSIFLRANKLAAGYKYNGGTTTLVNSDVQLDTGTELHIAVTFNAKSKTTKVYVNDRFVAVSYNIIREPYEITRLASDSRNYIGRTQWWDTNVANDNLDYQGYIDEFHLFSMELNEQEINDLFSYMTTDINNLQVVNNVKENDFVYDISGRIINKQNLTSGIYIYRGKKFIVK